jgi:flagellar protein FliS
MTATALRASQLSQYTADAVLSAPPARLLTMLYDRLLLDLGRAQFAQENSNWPVATENLLHAQAIVTELAATLKADAWDGAENLIGIYDYALQAMIGANIHRDVERTKECISLMEPLRQGWHEAAASLSAQSGPARPGAVLGIG